MKTPFFSIIIPTYNRKAFLAIAINSIFRQTFTNYELIIVDDGSTDKTEEMIKRINQKNEGISRDKISQIKYCRQSHSGVSQARNKGILMSKGKFICFLDSDDRFCKEKLRISYDYIKRNPQQKVFHTEEVWYKNGKLFSEKKYQKKPNHSVFQLSVLRCCVSISTLIISKDIFKTTGYFDDNLPACEDYDFWLKAAARYTFFLIPHYLTIKEGGHKDQQSKKYEAMDKFRIYSLKNIINSDKLNRNDRLAACKELENKCSIYIKGAKKRKKIEEIKYYQNIIEKTKLNYAKYFKE